MGSRQDVHGIDLEQAQARDDAPESPAVGRTGGARPGESLGGQGDTARLGRGKGVLRLDRVSPAVA